MVKKNTSHNIIPVIRRCVIKGLNCTCSCAYLQEVLHERVKTYKNWKDAEAMLTKKRETKAKLELAHKTDKISQAEHEITEVRQVHISTF